MPDVGSNLSIHEIEFLKLSEQYWGYAFLTRASKAL